MPLNTQFSVLDHKIMARAIQLAQKGEYTCMPNPKVGCVLVNNAGSIVGEGWHRQAGKAHAEINALNSIEPALRKDLTAYVTLEPCSHYGRTPPCVEALIEAGVSRVVVGMTDPNPQVAGKGIEQLRVAGIKVDIGLLEAQAKALNLGFIQRMETGLPWVRCKMAMSVDGRTAMSSGESQWITGKEARSDVQRLRARSCAVVTGIESVLHDNPSMTFRWQEAGLGVETVLPKKQPLRVVVDSQLRMPVNAKMLAQEGEIVIVCSAVSTHKKNDFLSKAVTFRAKYNLDSAHCIEVIELPDNANQVNLQAMFNMLGQREKNEVLLESGSRLAGSAMAHHLVDELWIYMAGALMGSNARPLFTLPIEKMSDKIQLNLQDIRAVGNDWRMIAMISKC